MELTIKETLEKGIKAHKENKWQDAERFYRIILQSQPHHPEANHNLGLLALQFSKFDTSITFFKIALDSNPKKEQFWFSYIDALIRGKQTRLAIEIIKNANDNGLDKEKLKIFQIQLESIILIDELKSNLNVEKPKEIIPTKKNLQILLACYENGLFIETENLAKTFINKYPKNPFAYKVLGAVLRQIGKNHEAIKFNQAAIELSPKDEQAHNNLGLAFYGSGRLVDAELSFVQAITLQPNFAEAYYNRGIILYELLRLDEAVDSYNKAISIKPDYAQAYSNLGNILTKLDKLYEAELNLRRAIELKPNYAEAYCNLGVTLIQLNKYEEAKEILKIAISLKHDFAEAHSNLGNVFKMLGKLEEAEISYKKAIALKPDYAKAHSNLGGIYKDLGKLDEAKNSYLQAISARPDYAEAHRYLTIIKKYSSKDDQFLKMQELYLNDSTSEEQLCHINFGLAKAFEDLGDFNQAFIHYKEGNILRKKILQYDIKKDEEIFKLIESSYSVISKNFIKNNQLEKKLVPIFILGMPRSGTTLVEQIISSHSQVTGAGELPFIAQFGWQLIKDFPKVNNSSLLNFRNTYLENLKNISNNGLIVTDKMPQNFRFIGLIAAAFPEAKIIHVKRNPSALCWANYKQYFASNTIGYCYSLDDIISYYQLYKNIMNFWNKSLSKRIYNLDYELLVNNQETETYKLIEYIGLDWDEKCLSPEDNKRAVTTASNLQVRKKIYQGSSNQWKNYEPFLNGALDYLD